MRSATRWKYAADVALGRQGMKSYIDRAKVVAFGIGAPLRYDVLHYYFGQSFLYWNPSHFSSSAFNKFLFADLFLAKKLGRKSL